MILGQEGITLTLIDHAVVLWQVLLRETGLVVVVAESLAHQLGLPVGAGVFRVDARDDERHDYDDVVRKEVMTWNAL